MPRTVVTLLVTLVAGSLLSGCASIRNSKDMETERLLAAGGFQMRLADTDDKLAQLSQLPQQTVVPRQHDGKTYYVYADQKVCKCLYVGTQRAYDRYQRLALAHEASVRRLEAAEAQEDAAMDLSTWGPWGPWWW